MEFTNCVMREVLRFRPPATMVPHQALQDFAVTEDFIAPKGSLVIPSVLESAFQGWSNPHTVCFILFSFFCTFYLCLLLFYSSLIQIDLVKKEMNINNIKIIFLLLELDLMHVWVINML